MSRGLSVAIGLACVLLLSLSAKAADPAMPSSTAVTDSQPDDPTCKWMRHDPLKSTDLRALYTAVISVAGVAGHPPFADMPREPAFAKKDYETSAEYDARVRTLLSALALPANGMVVAVASARNLGSYDADSAKLTVTDRDLWGAFNEITSSSVPFGRYAAIFQTPISANGKSYIGETAFGIRRQVRQSTTRFWGAVFAPTVDYSPAPIVMLAVTLPAAIAKTERPNFELVVAGHLGPPYEVDEQGGHSADLDWAQDTFDFSHGVVLDSPCVALRSRATGTILATFKLPTHNRALY